MEPSETTGHATPAAQPDAPPRTSHDDDPLDRRLYLLARAEPFHTVDRDTLERLAELLQPREVVAGEIVCRRGDPADAFYVIESGSLAVLWQSEQRVYTLRELGPGDAFGEIALLRGGLRTADVRAESAAKLWELSTYAFALLRAQSPSLDAAIEQLARAHERDLREISFGDAPGNLAALAPEGGLLRIGRRADNDLVFSSPLVSNHHALLERQGDEVRLRDAHSSSGTFVNGKEIAGAVALHDGDEIWIGDERLIFDRSALQHCSESRGLRISANDLVAESRAGARLLDGVSLSILPGELVGIAGGDGEGASALLALLAGLRPPSAGRIDYNGRDLGGTLPRYRDALGYAPRADSLHSALPLRQALTYASRLRLPADTLATERDARVAATLNLVQLTPRANTRIASLTGEERKRAEIAVELLGGARAIFLEQPTAGLGPVGAKRLVRLLRQLADAGSTAICTSQVATNLELCNKVVLLASDGTLAFAGTPARAQRYFGATSLAEVVALLDEGERGYWDARFRASPDYAALLSEQLPAQPIAQRERAPFVPRWRNRDFVHQLRALVERNVALFLAERRPAAALLALAVGVPLLLLAIVGAQSFALSAGNPRIALVIVYLLVAGGAVYGLASGTPAIVSEQAIFRRERAAGLSTLAYLLAKAVVAAPLLLLVELLMLVVLLLGQRLPARGLEVYAPLLLLLWLNAIAALALGLLASALAPNRMVASRLAALFTLLQLFFAGAILAVPAMLPAGRWLSRLLPATWTFAAAGHVLDLDGLFKHGTSPIAPALLLDYRDTFAANIALAAVVLALFAALLLAATVVALEWRFRRDDR